MFGQQRLKELQRINQPVNHVINILKVGITGVSLSHEYEQTINVFFDHLDVILVVFPVQIPYLTPSLTVRFDLNPLYYVCFLGTIQVSSVEDLWMQNLTSSNFRLSLCLAGSCFTARLLARSWFPDLC